MNILLLTYSIILITVGKNIQDDKVLFDGISLNNWQVIDFEGHGNISIVDSSIIIGKGESISGEKILFNPGIGWVGRSNGGAELY